MVAAGCMVLYGFDAAIFNNVQDNAQWLAWFDHPVCLPRSLGIILVLTNSTVRRTLRPGQHNLFDRCYHIWMVHCWSNCKSPHIGQHSMDSDHLNRLIVLVGDGQWESDASLQLLLLSSRHSLQNTRLASSSSGVF